jgi:hypothetical protein
MPIEHVVLFKLKADTPQLKKYGLMESLLALKGRFPDSSGVGGGELFCPFPGVYPRVRGAI